MRACGRTTDGGGFGLWRCGGVGRSAAGATHRGGDADRRPAGSGRHGNAPRGKPQQGADQRDRAHPGEPRPARHQGLFRGCPLHSGREFRYLRHQQHLDPWYFGHGRRRHHRYLPRRHADPDARARLQSRRSAAEILRHRSRRSAARTAGYAVRRRLRGRHGALHHDAAQSLTRTSIYGRGGSLHHRGR